MHYLTWIASPAFLIAVTAHTAPAYAEDGARLDGSANRVSFVRADGSLLLHFEQAARAFGWEPKVAVPGKLVTACRAGNDAYCVPIPLKEGNFRDTPAGLFVEAQTLGKGLGFSVAERDGDVVLMPLAVRKPGTADPADPESHVPAYHADWGPGRGFQPGRTLPDIPLYDLDGNEVRFSRFLGKQYVIYCWASW